MGLKLFNNFLMVMFLASLVTIFLLKLSVLFGLLCIILVSVVFLVIREARVNYGVLEECGIPVVEPTLFLGSEPNLHNTVLHLADIERFKKYGPIWGSYFGKMPHIYITEPELIRRIFVKDFDHFRDRQDMELGGEMLNEIMKFQKGEKWKQIRTFLSPLFTTSKTRQMSGVVAECAEEFVNDLKRECETNGIGRVKIHCRERFTTCLIDMLVRTTFGIKIEDGKNPENKFSRSFREMLHEEHEYKWLFTLTLSFPFLQKLSPVYDQEPGKYIERKLEKAIKSRK